MVRADKLANLSKRAARARNSYEAARLKEVLVDAGMDPNRAEEILTSPASTFELMRWASSLSTSRWSNLTWAPSVIAAAKADGFEPDDDERWLSDYIWRAEGGDE